MKKQFLFYTLALLFSGASLFLLNSCGGKCNCDETPQNFHVVTMETDGIVFGWEATSPPNLFRILITNTATNESQAYTFSNAPNDTSTHKVKFADFSGFVKEGELYKATIKKDCTGKQICSNTDFSPESEEVSFIRKKTAIDPFVVEVVDGTSPCDSLQIAWTPFAGATSYRVNILNSNPGTASFFQDSLPLNPTEYGRILQQGTNTIWVDAMAAGAVIASTNTLVICCIVVIEDDIENIRNCGTGKELMATESAFPVSATLNKINHTFALLPVITWKNGAYPITAGFASTSTPTQIKVFACPKWVVGLYDNVRVHYTKSISELPLGSYNMHLFQIDKKKCNYCQ